MTAGRLLAAARRAGLCGVVLALAGVVGLLLHQPWLFPGLGPTLLVLAGRPDEPAAHPRNVLVGHLVAVAAGWTALLATGLRSTAATLTDDLTGQRVAAAALALAATALVLHLLRCDQPAAGATALVVGLGLLTTPGELAALVLSVVLVLAVATALPLLLGSRAGQEGGGPGHTV